MESIRTHLATGLPNITTLTSPKQVAGIVGAGRGAYVGELRGPFSNLSQVMTDYDNTGATLTQDGHTAVVLWATDFFANGGKYLWVSESDVTALATITCTGDGTQRSFDMIVDKTGGAGALALSPVPGTLHVEHPLATDLTYGTDYIVDWSQGIVHFAVAPAAAANNIQIEWKEYTAVLVAAAFVFLESAPISLVGGAYFASDNGYDLVDEIDTHCDTSATNRRQRFGFGEGYYHDSAGLIAGPGAYATRWVCGTGNRSGWFNDNLTDPTVTWLEFNDPSAVAMGIASSVSPQITLHEKPATNLNQKDEWDSTTIGLFNAAHINYFGYDGISAYNYKDGYNLEGAAADFRYIDAARSWIYIKDRVKIAMFANNCISCQVARAPILAVEQVILNELNMLYKEKVINDPAELTYSYPQYKPVMSQLIEAFKKPASERSPEELAYIQARQADRTEPIYVYYDYQGALHYIDLYLGGL